MVGRRLVMRSVSDFLRWEPLLSEEKKDQLRAISCPEQIGKVRIRKDLDDLSLEDLCILWSCGSSKDLFVKSGSVLLGISERKVLRSDAYDMIGMVNMVSKELERITDLWNSIPSIKTPEEIMAGCNSLKFGMFGVVDWYARRMGIQDHDQVFATKWVRIYQCMRNDAEEALYRKRLSEIISQKQHRR